MMIPRFQSSLELSPECNEFLGYLGSRNAGVSILTRAIARVQRGLRRTDALAFVFQSSLELSPECNMRVVSRNA
ncbi:hypothetical protein K649_15185 [Meiothermus ruber DSM 1279]|uniref:Uncharacterized protein n=1 Tax=Meiothermus ruber (strain ATCC 35948 / DSM 1279 / VKM B-1258 / 21) TaxID=504728 RepID=M9XIP9_MEIRD|nr:hypothetical protein K649_15185 [Meiothermus ruber DSM 1279]